MSDQPFVENYIAGLQEALAGIDPAKIATAIEWLRAARDADRTVYSCGNGGSASIASQMVVDIVKGSSFKKKKRFRMIGLTDSVATITAYGNDEGYDQVFVEPLRNFAQPGDVLIAISGSGNSPNVLRAVEFANEAGCKTIGLTTDRGGRLREISQLPIVVPSSHMGHLEDAFFVMTHIMCYAFMQAS